MPLFDTERKRKEQGLQRGIRFKEGMGHVP